MGAKAVHDLLGQALAFEARHGDRAPQIVAERAERLRKAGKMVDALFWSQVADCLTELHAIRYGSAQEKGALQQGRQDAAALSRAGRRHIP